MSIIFPSSSFRGFMMAFCSDIPHENGRALVGRIVNLVKVANCGRSNLRHVMLCWSAEEVVEPLAKEADRRTIEGV
jgi:hypothetical protein